MEDHVQDRSIPGEKTVSIKTGTAEISLQGTGNVRAGGNASHDGTQRGRDIQREKTNLVNALESHWYSDMLKTVVQNKIKEHPPESHKTGNSACKEIVKRGWRGRILSATKLHNDGMERTYWVMQVLNDKGRRRVADGGDG
jgi:hypothetical protein